MLTKFQNCSRANIKWKTRKYERGQDIRVDDLRLQGCFKVPKEMEILFCY